MLGSRGPKRARQGTLAPRWLRILANSKAVAAPRAITGDNIRTRGLVFDDLVGEVLGDVFDAVHGLGLTVEARWLEREERLIVSEVLRECGE